VLSTLSDEQLRAAINLAEAYETWLPLARAESAYADRLLMEDDFRSAVPLPDS